MLSPIGLLVGLVLLVYGRRLYWLFVAGIGFLTGLALAPRLLVGQPEWMILLVALILALIGALLAVVAQKFVVGLVGVGNFVDLSRGSVVLLVGIVALVGILVQARVVGGPSRRTHTTR